MATILDERTEEEIEEYRQDRINQFVWLVNNLKDAINGLENANDPDSYKLCYVLVEKLQLELKEFMME